MAKGTGIPTQSILAVPDFVQNVVLAANTGQAFDTPTGMAYVVFSFNADFWAKYGSTSAAIPTSSSTIGSSALSSELNPTARNIQSTATTSGISLIADSACKGSMAWFKAG